MNKKFLSIVILTSTFALSAADGGNQVSVVPTTTSSWSDVPVLGVAVRFWSYTATGFSNALKSVLATQTTQQPAASTEPIQTAAEYNESSLAEVKRLEVDYEALEQAKTQGFVERFTPSLETGFCVAGGAAVGGLIGNQFVKEGDNLIGQKGLKIGLPAAAGAGLGGYFRNGIQVGASAFTAKAVSYIPSKEASVNALCLVKDAVVSAGSSVVTSVSEHPVIATTAAVAAVVTGYGVYYNSRAKEALVEDAKEAVNALELPASSEKGAEQSLSIPEKAEVLAQIAPERLHDENLVDEQVAAQEENLPAAQQLVVEPAVISAPARAVTVEVEHSVVKPVLAPAPVQEPVLAPAPVQEPLATVAAVRASLRKPKAVTATNVDKSTLRNIIDATKILAQQMTPGNNFKHFNINLADDLSLPTVRQIAGVHQYALETIPAHVVELADTIISYSAFLNYVAAKRGGNQYGSMSQTHLRNIQQAIAQAITDFDNATQELLHS